MKNKHERNDIKFKSENFFYAWTTVIKILVNLIPIFSKDAVIKYMHKIPPLKSDLIMLFSQTKNLFIMSKAVIQLKVETPKILVV